MAYDPFNGTAPTYHSSGNSADYVPLPEQNPAFHTTDFSAPISSGGNFVDDIFGGVKSFISGVGDIFTTGLNSASDIAGAYNRYDSTVNPPQSNMNNLLLIGGGILLLALVLK